MTLPSSSLQPWKKRFAPNYDGAIPRFTSVLFPAVTTSSLSWSGKGARVMRRWSVRAEEHTSEIQSLMRISYGVFCLKIKQQPTTKLQKQNLNTHARIQLREDEQQTA